MTEDNHPIFFNQGHPLPSPTTPHSHTHAKKSNEKKF